jgi:hypothetical protein
LAIFGHLVLLTFVVGGCAHTHEEVIHEDVRTQTATVSETTIKQAPSLTIETPAWTDPVTNRFHPPKKVTKTGSIETDHKTKTDGTVQSQLDNKVTDKLKVGPPWYAWVILGAVVCVVLVVAAHTVLPNLGFVRKVLP